jgi:hypothetical protein
MNQVPDEHEVSERARANWRRVRDFFGFLGRIDHDQRLLALIARSAPLAPCATLARARLGHRQGSGRMRPSNAQRLVGPFLGVTYDVRGRIERLPQCAGAVSGPVRERLHALSDDTLFSLADHWVDYLCGLRADPAAPLARCDAARGKPQQPQ